MAFFQKKPQTSDSAPLYTLGMNTTVMIVGLGNIGKKYEKTRHNVGFMCVDAFAEANEFDPWIEKKDFQAVVTSKTLGDVRVILVKPMTMMNLSGEAVRAAARFYHVETGKIIVVHDEIDIPFGQIRMRMGGGSAGHNGIKSITQHIGDSYGRVRIGVLADKPAAMDTADYVLAKFNKDELYQLPALNKEINSILTEYIYRGDLTPETRGFIV